MLAKEQVQTYKEKWQVHHLYHHCALEEQAGTLSVKPLFEVGQGAQYKVCHNRRDRT